MAMQKRMGWKGAPVMSDPIPQKFHANDLDWLDLTAKRSGLNRAEVIRRSVRLLVASAKSNPDWNWVRETSQELPPLGPMERAELGLPGGSGALPGLGANFNALNDRARQESEAERRTPRKKRS
jgi:hypothetical protein